MSAFSDAELTYLAPWETAVRSVMVL